MSYHFAFLHYFFLGIVSITAPYTSNGHTGTGSFGWEARASSRLWGIVGEQRLFILTLGALSPFCTPLPPAPVSTGPWRVPPMSVQPSGLGQPGATALLPVVGAPPKDIGAARRAPGWHHARPRTRSNGRTVTCSPAPVSAQGGGFLPSLGPVLRTPPWTPPHSLLPLHPQSAHLARCSVPALSRAHASVLICSLAPPACRNPASLAVTAPEGRWVWVLCPDSRVGDQAGGGAGVVVTCNSNLPCLSCCTTARVCPLPSARAPSCLCPGASP